MKPFFHLVIAVVLATVTVAHDAINCFQESLIMGGSTEASNQMTDLDEIEAIDFDHVLTGIKVCTNRAVTFIKGVQVSYGKFSGDSEIVEAVSLTPYGDVDYSTAVCTIFYIPKGDYLANLLFRYNDTGVT